MKILIWGTGNLAERLLQKGLKEHHIIGFIETVRTKESYHAKPVFDMLELPTEYDVILVANRFGDVIYDNCHKNGIPLDKLCFIRPVSRNIDIEENFRLAKQILSSEWYDNACAFFGRVENDWVATDALLYSKLNEHPTMKIEDDYYNNPVYIDKYVSAGSVGSYFWQDLWAARKICRISPKEHYDIGSRVDGFISHLLSFRDRVTMIDIRPLNREVEGLHFVCDDATNLNSFEDNSIESLSALCSLEHFGLGRYGDKIDPDGCYKCFEAIGRKIMAGGNIYISVPVGKEHIEFNAHRVFYASTIIDAFSQCELVEYSYTKNGYMEYHVDVHKYDNDITRGGEGFGLFHFKKKYQV